MNNSLLKNALLNNSSCYNQKWKKSSLKILTKSKKSLSEINQLYNEFSTIKFFQKFLKNNLKKKLFELLSRMSLINYKKNQIIFHEGDISEKFYILLEGEISVYIKNKRNPKRNTINHNQNLKYLKKNIKMFDKKTGQFLHQKVGIIKKGDSFGELGLIQNSRRLATLISDENCKCGIIYAKDFLNILNNTVLTKINKKLKYFRDLFKEEFTNNEVFRISAYFKKYTFLKGKFVFSENEKEPKIFIICHGEILIQKKIHMKKKNFSVVNNLRNVYKHKTSVKNDVS